MVSSLFYKTSQGDLSIAIVHHNSYLECKPYLLYRTCRTNSTKSLESAKEKLWSALVEPVGYFWA